MAILIAPAAAGCTDGVIRVDLPVYEVWIGDDDLTVYAQVGRGACDEVEQLMLDETDSRVEVAVRARRPTTECPAEEIVSEFSAVLDGPLGDRELEAWPATTE